MGLANDLATIRTASLDRADYPNLDYDVIPLSQTEYAELLRRSGVQWAMGPLMTEMRRQPGYAGAYIDQRAGGIPVFLYAKAADVDAGRLATALPDGTDFRVVLVDRTEVDLLAIQSRLDADWEVLRKDGIEILSTGIVDDQNAVRVGVRGLTPEIEERLQKAYGPGLVFREDTESVADNCVNKNDCRPIKGGLVIRPSTNLSAFCTSGYIVRRLDDGKISLLTAGHCITVHGGLGTGWRHNGDQFGKAQATTWKAGLTRTADVGIISLGALEVPTSKNEIHVGGGNVRKVVNFAAASEQVFGGQAILFGGKSGYSGGAGTITARNVSRPSKVNGVGTMTVTKTMEVSFDAMAGDSGGPFFYIAPSGGVNRIALGTHVHSVEDGTTPPRAWYSPIDTGRLQLESQAGGFGYVLCITTSC